MKRALAFEKESDDKWYVVLPEWEGDHAELEMVSGADTMLDILAQGESKKSLIMSDEKMESNLELTYVDDCCDGANYLANSFYIQDLPVRLCHVTEVVFGDLPKMIYIKS